MDDKCSICEEDLDLIPCAPGIDNTVCLGCVHRADELVRGRIRCLHRRVSPKRVDKLHERLYREAYAKLREESQRQGRGASDD